MAPQQIKILKFYGSQKCFHYSSCITRENPHKPQNCHEIFIRRNITIGRQKPLNYENIIEGADHKRIPNVQQRVSVFVGEKEEGLKTCQNKGEKEIFQLY